MHPRSAAVAFSHMRAWREAEAPPTLLKKTPSPNPSPKTLPKPSPNPNPNPKQVEALPLGPTGGLGHRYRSAIVLEDDVKLAPGRASTWLGIHSVRDS
jgi:hypothetical protein